MNEKGNLHNNQQAFIRRKQSTLARLDKPFPRPSKPFYQGQPHILVGVALGLDKPATVAVVDGLAGKEITYRIVKQLLGDNYELLNKGNLTNTTRLKVAEDSINLDIPN